MTVHDIFLITSVINTGNHPWSYTNTRSVFSMEDRFRQSLHTIQTIREKMPEGTRIYFVECSDIPESMEEALKKATDQFFQCKEVPSIRAACIQSTLKGYGELLKTLLVAEYLLRENIQFRRLFKISGRYFLNDSFNSSKFSEESFTFRTPFPNSVCNPTVLYSVPSSLLEHFREGLLRSDEEFRQRTHIMYELSMPKQMNPKQCIDSCGVSGYVAIDGTLYEDTCT